MKLNIRADRARLATTCMAVRDIRYYLNGILVEPRTEGGVFIIATDGHRMIAVIDETGECDEPTILRMHALVSKLPKPDASGHRSKQRLRLETFLGKPVLMLTDKLTGVNPEAIYGDVIIEGKFPDWRKVLPDFDKIKRGTKSAFNADYLSGVLSVFGRRHSLQAMPYQKEFSESVVEPSICFHIPSHEYACLVIMPIKASGVGIEPLAKNFSQLLPSPQQAADRAWRELEKLK